ncbi:NAD(P)/FAD-dependent oxidoreductase [Nocardioides sp. CER19]|uniref:flavin-containing monooxygenase n=1 Tax=Nocardioides sp. CER19 TaxID=3038538 RepID=UPI002446CA62|nr:NAD(P)/FAD-dependent oxidoreductase [Nocardioides sp. CER19]MDH2416156.1 NAD(P)/FAD-dependent oxidoreductase [Nocardioides sp. CER19]
MCAGLPTRVDVLVVGAGLSGIGAAARLARECPDLSVAILESRERLGGTWDLFRYPGIRSDSDIPTLAFPFRPWTKAVSIADGPSILSYLDDTADEYGLKDKIHFGCKVVHASWDSDLSLWTVEVVVEQGGGPTKHISMTCSFLYLCTGYYSYDKGYAPTFPNQEAFTGPLVHPQAWPEDLDYEGKRVAVIGSGATAITLVPALTERASHVTMVQRSPTYVMSVPRLERSWSVLSHVFGERGAAKVIFWKNVLGSLAWYQLSRRRPAMVKSILAKEARNLLPAGYDLQTHLTPHYDPWDQRLCATPDGELFDAIRSGQASISTGVISRFTESGIELEGGEEIDADIIITATGLNMLALGAITFDLDGDRVDVGSTIAYKGMMLCGVPNLAWTLGYTNASWTLKADLVATYVCRLLNHMSEHHLLAAEPTAPTGDPQLGSVFDLNANYVHRGIAAFPKQASLAPWRLHHNYLADRRVLRRGDLTDRMTFVRAAWDSNGSHVTPRLHA